MECVCEHWLDAAIDALADARAMLASFGVRDTDIEMRIDTAMAMAGALKRRANHP